MIETRTSFDTVVEQHEELRELIADLREFLQGPRPESGKKGSHTWAFSLSEKLTRFHDKIFRHFREEEETGFLEELRRDNPSATHQLDALQADHATILADVRALLGATLAYGEGKPTSRPRLRRWTTSILDQLSEHERQETELLQRTYCEDLGLGD